MTMDIKRSFSSALKPLTPDPLFSLIEQYRADPRGDKRNLIMGVYCDDGGHTPTLAAVYQAEAELLAERRAKGYGGLSGNPEFNAAIARQVLGNDQGRLSRQVTIQTVGGTGALRLLGDFIFMANPQARVWVSNPGYVNHEPIMRAAHLRVGYYGWKAIGDRLDIETIAKDIQLARPGDILLLQGCGHNPTGMDPTLTEWQILADLCNDKGLVPLIDIAYQGLARGLEEDAEGLRLLADQLDTILVASSCSKNMGLYCERIGAATFIGGPVDDLPKVVTTFESIARRTYSVPPEHGASVAAKVFSNADFWHPELESMRKRISTIRSALSTEIESLGATTVARTIANSSGMFACLPLSGFATVNLAETYGIYCTRAGRINLSGIPIEQIHTVAEALVGSMQTDR